MDASIAALLSIALGIGLAAATGFRVFIPLLVAGAAARADWIPLSEGFSWLASTPALITLASAALAETLAYCLPGVDHVLDVLAAPAAVAAGVVGSAAVMTEIPPSALWPIAIIAGGGVAGLTKGSSALLRAKTGVATLGVGNPVVSTAETAGAAVLSLLAIALPILCVIVVIALLIWVVRSTRRLGLRLRDPRD